MKQRYTFLGLLTDISKKTQPEKVVYRKKEFMWNPAEGTYKDDKGKELASYMSNYTTGSLTVQENLTADKQIINEQELAYLKVVLAPIRKRLIDITKRVTTGGCMYLDVTFTELPEYDDKEPGHLESWAFKKDEAFTGMKPGFRYTPEDLDL